MAMRPLRLAFQACGINNGPWLRKFLAGFDVKLALLKGNRFNPYHLQAFQRLRERPEVVAFRCASETAAFPAKLRGGGRGLKTEPLYFDTEAGAPLHRLKNVLLQQCGARQPHVLPFHERLRDFDLIQSWELFTDWSAEAAEARRRWNIPLCVMVWDQVPLNMERNPARRQLKQHVATAADRFVVHTERSRDMLASQGVDAGRIVEISPGIDVDRFAPGKVDRAAFGLSEEDFVILFEGWLRPGKGIDFLLLALREMVHDPLLKHKRVRLLVVGSGPARSRLEQWVRRLDLSAHCVFAGALSYDRMPEAFRAADAFVLPNVTVPEWQEPANMALIEAMACGVPVITTHGGASAELAGKAALLCPPNDFVALHEAMKDLLLDAGKRAELGALGRLRARSKFNLPRYARALSSLYAEMLSA